MATNFVRLISPFLPSRCTCYISELLTTCKITKIELNRTLEVVEVEGSLDSIGNLVNLVSLRVNIYSDWDHPLSAALSKLKHLTRLELALIRYTGGFPEEILLMNSLEYLALQGSVEDSFDGSVPAAFCDLDQLKSIRFSGTALRGFEICSGKLPNLEVLSLEQG